MHDRLPGGPASMSIMAGWTRAPPTALSAVLRAKPHRAINNPAAQASLHYGILGIEGRLLAPGIFDVRPLVALLAAHEARMPVACCATYPCSRLVALVSGSFVLLANVEAAADITDGLLKTDGVAAAGFGTWLPTAEHSALFAADC